MNTSANNQHALAKALAAVLLLSFVLILITTSQLTWSSAAMQERVLENKTRKEVPIRLKTKKEKEKSFKDFKNDKWVREFELELTNTGEADLSRFPGSDHRREKGWKTVGIQPSIWTVCIR